MLSFILFFISDSTLYFGNDVYMSLISKLKNCSTSLNFSSFMSSTKRFESLIEVFSDAVKFHNSFVKCLSILYTVEILVGMIISLVFKGFLCIFNNGLAKDVFCDIVLAAYLNLFFQLFSIKVILTSPHAGNCQWFQEVYR